MRSVSCKKCSGKSTVVWDDEYQIWICWRCGWIDKERGKKNRDQRIVNQKL